MHKVLLTILATSLLPCSSSWASETLEQLLQRLRITEIQHYNYTETRNMEMLQSPWHGTGDLIITPTQVFIEQVTPKNTLVSISETEAVYTNIDTGVKRVKPLSSPFNVPGLGKILQIMYGLTTEKSIKKDFRFILKATENRWILRMTPRLFKIARFSELEMSGRLEAPPDVLALEFSDGDKTTWKLKPVKSNTSTEESLSKIQSLLNKI